MSLPNLLPQLAQLSRFSAIVLTQSAWPFTAAVTFAAEPAARLRLKGSGLSLAPTITITGTLSGVGQTETVTLPTLDPQLAISTKRWSTVTQIASTSAPAGTLTVIGIQQSGEPIVAKQVLDSALKVRLTRKRLTQVQIDTGLTQLEEYICYTIRDGILPNDLLVIDGISYTVENVSRLFGRTSFHHSELQIQRLVA